jgi:hypothetical protein
MASATFRVIVAVDTGEVRRKLFLITRERSGVYLATNDPGLHAVHVSYKQDGTVFFRAERIPGPDPPPMPMTPLNAIRGFVVFPMMHVPLPQSRLDRLPPLVATDRADAVVSVDSRSVPTALDCRVYLVEPGQRLRPLVPGTLLAEVVVEETVPWILVQACDPSPSG